MDIQTETFVEPKFPLKNKNYQLELDAAKALRRAGVRAQVVSDELANAGRLLAACGHRTRQRK